MELNWESTQHIVNRLKQSVVSLRKKIKKRLLETARGEMKKLEK
jgi:hypothetical protein